MFIICTDLLSEVVICISWGEGACSKNNSRLMKSPAICFCLLCSESIVDLLSLHLRFCHVFVLLSSHLGYSYYLVCFVDLLGECNYHFSQHLHMFNPAVGCFDKVYIGPDSDSIDHMGAFDVPCLTVDYMALDLVCMFLFCIVGKTGFPLVYFFQAHLGYPSVGFLLVVLSVFYPLPLLHPFL